MWRRLFTFCSAVSLLLCAAACVLWAARLQHPRVGNGWLFRASRYTLSLSPDRLAVLGPPPPATDPAAAKSVDELAEIMRRTGGTLRYDGLMGGQGFGELEYFSAASDARVLLKAIHLLALSPSLRFLDDAPIRMLMAALEDERFFLLAHALLTETDAGGKASDNPQITLQRSLNETAGRRGHWTGKYDGVRLELLEDRPRVHGSVWGDDIHAVVTTPITPGERAEVCRRWHERLDVPLRTVQYWQVALLALIVPAANLTAFAVRRVRHRQRCATGRCPACGYDLRASPDRCPECGAIPGEATAE